MSKTLQTPRSRLELVEPDSEVLQQLADAVDEAMIPGTEIQTIIDDMLAIANGEQGDAKRPTLVGLAAPQVGVKKRIVIIGVNADGKGARPDLKVFINPEIVEQSDETEEGREGCYSTSRVCGAVERKRRVVVKALDRNGQEFTQILEGFPARVAQHEIDHLDGIRFPQRITDDRKLHWVPEEQFGEYRERWAEWTTLCSREEANRILNLA